MNRWHQNVAILLLPLSLCGFMLLIVPTSKWIASGSGWPIRAAGLLLMTPGIAVMLVSSRLGQDDEDPGDEPDEPPGD